MKNRFNPLPYIIFLTSTITFIHDRTKKPALQNCCIKTHTENFLRQLRNWMLIIAVAIAFTAWAKRSKLPMDAS